MKILHFLILDLFYQRGNIDDFALAEYLHSPRSFLLDTLAELLEEGYIIHNPNGYILTEKGNSARIPLTFYQDALQTVNWESNKFDWTQLYIPEAGWLDE